MTHTLGPTVEPLWITGPSTGRLKYIDDGGDFAIINEHQEIIGEAYHYVNIEDTVDAKANATLWIAASDLLEHGLALANEVRAALTLLSETTAGEPLGWTNIRCLERHLEAMDAAIAKAKGEQDAS